jgi:hypothetical protein
VGPGGLIVASTVLIDRLKVVISGGNVTGCCKMMVLASWVALGVGHDGILR